MLIWRNGEFKILELEGILNKFSEIYVEQVLGHEIYVDDANCAIIDKNL